MTKLIFYYSGMNAGKSAHLLQKSHNLESKGVPVSRFTHILDNRWGAGLIISRIGIEAQAQTFDSGTDFNSLAFEKGTWIFIDEAQFLTKKQIVTLANLVDHNKLCIICYGLRTDFMGEPFEGSTYLMAWADEVREIESHDAHGDKATFNIRIDENGARMLEGSQMDIGTHYKSISRKDFFLKNVQERLDKLG
jgi:thymidine kinase